VDGGNYIQMWSTTENTVNKHSHTADKGWSSSLELGVRLTILLHIKITMLQSVMQGLRPEQVVYRV
jgi:hypothetical protein